MVQCGASVAGKAPARNDPSTTDHCPLTTDPRYNHLMSDVWRLLISPSASGRRNMAVDEAILEAVAAAASPPTLRLYAWDPPCLSLGRAQPIEVVDEPALAATGWDLVRRPTGGRALLHADELTYAVVAPDRMPALSGGVLASYRELSRGLLAGLERLGLHPDPPAHAELTEADRSNPVCFEVPSAYEITVGGRKLIGSAQLRRRGVVLQHGSLPLEGDITRVARVLRHADPVEQHQAAGRLTRHAVTLKDLLGSVVPWEEASRALQAGFAQALGWNFIAADLTSLEALRAQQIETERNQVEESARAS